MSSKEEILARIRQNTGTRYEKPDIAAMKRLAYPDKIEQFCAVSRAVGGTAVVLGEGEDVNAVIRRNYPDAMRIASVLPDISCATFNPDNLDDPKELDGTDVAVIKGEIGVAENGAIWIPQEVKYKALYFISERLVILIDRNKIVNTMYDAYRELDGQDYKFGTFISGPSKTADIEQIKAGEVQYDFVEVMACKRGCIAGGGQPVPIGPRTKQARLDGMYKIDSMAQIKRSDENPIIAEVYEGILKGKEHKLLHNR